MSTQVQTDKRAKFVELAEKRTTNALQAIALIGNLANRSAYDYTPLDAAKIVKALADAVETINNRFRHVESPKPAFKLS